MKQDAAMYKMITIFLLACLLLSTVGCMNPPDPPDTTTSPEDSTSPPETTQVPETTNAPKIIGQTYCEPKNVTGEADTLALLQAVFAKENRGRTELIILDSYEELLGAYAYLKTPQPDGAGPITQQNVTEAELTGAYPPEYFETGHLIALCDFSDISNPGIECEVVKDGKFTVVNEHYREPARQFVAPSCLFYLLPQEGRYVRKPFVVNRILIEEPSETTDPSGAYEEKKIYTYIHTPKTVEGEADTRALLQAVFAEENYGNTELIVIDTYEELLAAYALLNPPRPAGPFAFTRENVTEAELTAAYPPEYFETGYLIVLCDFSAIYNPSIACDAEKRGNVIVVNEHYCTPAKKINTSSCLFYLLPLEGTYAGETVEFNRIMTEEPPETTNAPETEEEPKIYTFIHTPKTVEGEADTLALLQTVFSEENFDNTQLIILDTYEELLGAYAYLNNPLPPGHRVCTRQNVTEAQTTGTYPPEYFETGYLVALCDFSWIYNPGIECDAEKREDVIVVNEHYCDPFMRADLPSTIFYLLPLEGAYAGETVEFNRIVTAEPPRY